MGFDGIFLWDLMEFNRCFMGFHENELDCIGENWKYIGGILQIPSMPNIKKQHLNLNIWNHERSIIWKSPDLWSGCWETRQILLTTEFVWRQSFRTNEAMLV